MRYSEVRSGPSSRMISIALIGYGYWGPNLARNLIDSGSFALAAVADVHPERRQEAARRHAGVETCADAARVMCRDDVDAVAIATPLRSHFPLAKLAIESGKHVLVEKPLAASRAEAEVLAELADRHAVRLMVDHTFVYTGAVRKMRALISAGELGTLLYLDSVRVNLGLFQQDSNVIWDLAVHDLAIMDYLVDERPVAISASGGAVAGYAHENIAYVTVHFDSGFLAHFHVNWLAPVKVRQMLLGGLRRMVVYDDLSPSDKIRVYDKGVEFDVQDEETRRQILVSYRTGDMNAPKIDRREALALVTAEFAASIRDGRPAATDAAAGVRVVAMLEAAEQSLRAEGRRVCV
jgi:predicted dehydrogenase